MLNRFPPGQESSAVQTIQALKSDCYFPDSDEYWVLSPDLTPQYLKMIRYKDTAQISSQFLDPATCLFGIVVTQTPHFVALRKSSETSARPGSKKKGKSQQLKPFNSMSVSPKAQKFIIKKTG